MTFEKGQSGNPAGRPKGAKNRSTELRALLEPHAPALIDKAVQMALDGDIAALKMCLDKILPSLKSIDQNAVLNEDKPVKFVLKMGKNL